MHFYGNFVNASIMLWTFFVQACNTALILLQNGLTKNIDIVWKIDCEYPNHFAVLKSVAITVFLILTFSSCCLNVALVLKKL